MTCTSGQPNVLKQVELETNRYRLYYGDGELHITDKTDDTSSLIMGNAAELETLAMLIQRVAEKAYMEGI